MLSKICCVLDAPIKTVVISSWPSSQASAISARVWPRAAAISFNARIFAIFSGVMSFSFKKRPSVCTRLSAGMPSR